ncbi:MAG: sigma 54-interacting transcriptional regulator [Sandaracinaceae bacterium]|nr:sigma 54-interacting transcriptional regulator [Sandaracinaceae bacterium]
MRGLSRYRVIRALGAGAEGGVYLAEDRFVGGPAVALKRLHANADELLRASFEHEFGVLAALAIPGVARVIDFGFIEPDGDDPGGPFFTRSYVEGEPLSQVAGRLALHQRLAMVSMIAKRVAPLHRAGVVHGDLKPQNVIVDEAGTPTLIDFGLARLSREKRVDGSAASGTPQFMAPELFKGARVSVATDVYALGAMLWIAVTKKAPFEELGARALTTKAGGRAPTKPQGLSDDESRALDVALRALDPDPQQRLPAVTELAQAIDALLPPQHLTAIPTAFVAPRPRGHEGVLAKLDAWITERSSGSVESAEPIAVLTGVAGSGRSTLLRELKWRVQVRGVRTLDVAVRVADGLRPIEALLHQALVLTDDELARRVAEKVLDTIEKGQLIEEGALVDALARLLSALARRGPLLILVDDLDLGEDTLATALRVATHGETAERISVVASLSSSADRAFCVLGTPHLVRVPLLGRADVGALAEAAWGPVDTAVVDALFVRTNGNAQQLMQLLAALADNEAITKLDVESATPSAEATRAANARIEAVGVARPLLSLLATANCDVPVTLVQAFFAKETAARVQSWIALAANGGLVRHARGSIALADPLVARALQEALPSHAKEALAKAILAIPRGAPLPEVLKARLLIVAGEAPQSIEILRAAAREHEARGAHRAAIDLLTIVLDLATDEVRIATMLDLARLHYACGAYDTSIANAERVAADVSASADQRGHAAVQLGRAHNASGQYEAALRALEPITDLADPKIRAEAIRERAKAHLRRGEYDSVLADVAEGFAVAAANDVVRVELLTSAGMVASYRGDHAAARKSYQDAIALSKSVGSRRDEANAITYLAIDHHRTAEFAVARELYAQSLAIARELSDVGSMATYELNMGAASYDMAEPARAATHFEAAAKLAKRAGRSSTDVSARTNLANLHVYLGLYERALVEASLALRDADANGMRSTAAQAVLILGLRLARTGDVDGALQRCDEAAKRYRALAHWREVAESMLDGAEILLDRDAPMDPSAAAARLASARELCDEHSLTPLRLRLRLLLARARGATADPEGAIAQLDELLREVRASKDRELEWQTLVATAKIYELRGADFLSRRLDQMAVEVLEGIAASLPPDWRDAFWHDPRRRDARNRAAQAGEIATEAPMLEKRPRDSDSPRASRLLEITKRLAREHQIDRLLERITDAAVDLSGAERGFVLLTDESGALAPRTVRQAHLDDEAHVAFSRSIAEAVLIDGEPIVTVDARDDRRLNEYMSVHKLMLRSVACLPIRGQQGTVGVLYLEHRRRTGRFHEADMELLEAFADQAAIALENARLLSENESRRLLLEQANRELAAAKDEIERVLIARTEELKDTKAELDRTRHESLRTNARYGIVGRSEPMRRVFEIIDRLRDSSVPVVIHGESGTGKELIARALHSSSARANGGFVALNCAAIPEALLESELFGHVKGAFTGAERTRRGMISQASGGTLFLDEVGDMPPKMQIDLLRVLSDRRVRPIGSEHDEEVDVRIVAASNKSLEKLVAEGKFREDLYYRLNVVELRLPPLRDRGEDLPLLCDYFLAKFASQSGRLAKRLSRSAIERLATMRLPGNVRQLEHLLLNACVLVQNDVIEAQDIAPEEGSTSDVAVASARASDRPGGGQGDTASAPTPHNVDAFKDKERQRILTALEDASWNRVRAAEALGMPRRTFYRRLREYEIL